MINVDWDKFHEELKDYFFVVDNTTPLTRWVMNWVDIPPGVQAVVYRTADDKPLVLGKQANMIFLCALSPRSPNPPDFMSIPQVKETYKEVELKFLKAKQTRPM